MITLVTGAAGFIGFHLADRLLARGERVLGIDNLNDYYDPRLKHDRLAELDRRYGEAFTFLLCDFADDVALEAALEGRAFDRIAHLGAQAGVRHSIEQPRAFVRANLVGHLNLLEVARARKVAMVYASSSSVYGGNTSLPFRVEDRVDHPISLYAATKKADELMSESYAHLYRIPLTGLRFFTVYGPWGRPDMAVWKFTEAILEGRPIQLFNGGALKRDFTYIDDAIEGVIACLDRPPIAGDGIAEAGKSAALHRLYNIGNSRAEPLNELVTTIERACGREAIRDCLPMQPGDVTETFADICLAARDFGYAPETRISEGVPRFVDWYRAWRSDWGSRRHRTARAAAQRHA